jgi:Flp pilus assembly protein TadG
VHAGRKGTVSLELLIILVPVIFGLMGFAVDLGRLYLIRAELKTAAQAMALAAAQKLIGTDMAAELATAAANAVLDSESGYGNRYNFGGLAIGTTTGMLSSEAPAPSYYQTAAAALESGEGEDSTTAGSATAKYAKVTITADAPLLFWSFLPLGLERKTPIRAQAIAGISPPLCTACGIEPLAIAPLDPEETTDFGFVVNTKYTFAYLCSGQPAPAPLAGSVVQYLVLNRYHQEAAVFAEEATQLYRIGAQGLVPSTNPALACLKVASEEGEVVWESVAPLSCNQNPPSGVTSLLCGMWTRFDAAVPEACASIAEVDALQAYQADTDISDLEEYAAYRGNARRVITVPMVESLSGSGTMTVLGFRQFLVEPNPNDANINPQDADGRFVALYIGSVAPLKQGRFDGCQVAAGPGKVVLHQ